MNHVPGPRLRIGILAAGFSVRLGRPKTLARVRGLSLLRRTALLAQSLRASRIEVIVPPRSARSARPALCRHELRGTAARLVTNPRAALGLSRSVRLAATRARRASALLLLPVDLARLERRDLARLILRWRGARRSVAARCAGGRAVTPLILPRRLYGLAAAIAGDAGLKELIGGLTGERVLLLRLPSAAVDVDTPADLAAVRRRRHRPQADQSG